MPKVTVLMPVYNAVEFIREAVDSILKQSFSDFKFLIIDDGSTDGSQSIIRSYDDSRIRLVQNEKNIGVAATLNRGLDLALGEYVARMDADDICTPERLQKQVNFLTKHPDVGVCGSWVWSFNEKKKYIFRYPVEQDCVRSFLLFANPCSHPSVMMRLGMIRKYGLQYDPDYKAAQDYDLWRRCTDYFQIDNIPEPLVYLRRNEGGITWGKFELSNKMTLQILKIMLEKLGCSPLEEELRFHREVGNGSGVDSQRGLFNVADWLNHLLSENSKRGYFPQEGLQKATAFVWFRVCLNSSGMGWKVAKTYFKSDFRKWYKPGWDEFIYLVVNSIVRFNKAPTGRLQ